MVDFHQQHRHDAAAQAGLATFYDRWVNELEQFITALQAGGWVPAVRDPALLATEAFAYQEGLAAHAALYSLDAETFNTAVIDGLLALLTASDRLRYRGLG